MLPQMSLITGRCTKEITFYVLGLNPCEGGWNRPELGTRFSQLVLVTGWRHLASFLSQFLCDGADVVRLKATAAPDIANPKVVDGASVAVDVKSVRSPGLGRMGGMEAVDGRSSE
ncbi:hypothetical protein E2C01_022525 [Portunus trituberculatus]|uniref:Uncharacterized protein n=1 Tax=Portunus trituberculatus TaxID=210409 RepID=A0A5B7E676_PORTR|nr:hypothetical protein [Portunus trituberculatus]